MSARLLPCVILVLAALCSSGSTAPAAPSLSLAPSQRWAVLAARQSLDEAIDLARGYGREIAGVRVARAGHGWLAVIAGPVPAGSVEEAKKALGTALYLPDDLYLSRGEAYRDIAWSSPPPLVLGGVKADGGGGARLSREGVSITLDSVPAGEDGRIPLATVSDGEAPGVTARIDENPSSRPHMEARIVRLDAGSPRPQAVFSSFSGGAHCCTVTRILTRPAGGPWTVVEAPTLDGEGFGYEDIDQDGAAELVSVDNSFLYAFDSYAGSYAPPVISRLEGATLRKVTTEPRYRPYLEENLRRWERIAQANPDLWRSNGFLAGWVAAKAQLGQGDEAWARMLSSYDRNSDFGPSECTIAVPVEKCPQDRLRRIPFPQALRTHLQEKGYPVPGAARVGATPASAAATMSYAEAQAAFISLSLAERYELQMRLIAGGYWPAVSTDQFSHRLHQAILSFEVVNGLSPEGMMRGEQWGVLRRVSDPVLRGWQLRRVAHPLWGTPLWVPEGLGLARTSTSSGIVFERADHALRISFDAYPGLSLQAAFNAVVGAVREPERINYKVLRDDFFAVSWGQGDSGSYARFQAMNGGIIGFSIRWAPAEGVYGDRLATLMSDLFRAAFIPGQERSPPVPAAPVSVAALPAAPVAPGNPPADTSAPAEKPAPRLASTGSGFFVSGEGHMLTNAHVVEECASVAVSFGEERSRQAQLLARDGTNDLALLKTSYAPAEVATLRTGIRLGDPVAVFGFPLTGLLAAGGNFTLGNVTALAGLRDDSRILQISAPVQPGNSGGPLLDETGAVAGVVVAKLNALKLAVATDDIPQNVNFAIKAGVAAGFMEAQGLAPRRAEPDRATLKPADLADRAKSFTGLVECFK